MSRKTWIILGVVAALIAGGGGWYFLGGASEAAAPQAGTEIGRASCRERV